MAHCEMCGTEMPVAGDRCVLGHPIGAAAVQAPVAPGIGTLAESAPAPSPLPPPPPPPPPPAPAAQEQQAPVPTGASDAPPPPLPFSLPPIPAVESSSFPQTPAAAPLAPATPTPGPGGVPSPAASAAGSLLTAASGEIAAPSVEGALALEAAPTAAEPAAFAPPLVELVVAAEPKRRISRSLGVFLAVALVAAGAGGWVAFGPGGGSASAATYKRVLRAGESHSYTMSVAMRGGLEIDSVRQPLDMIMHVDITESVLSVAKDGVSTIRYTLDYASIHANGQQMQPPGKLSVTVRMAPDGRVLGTEGGAGLGAQNPLGDFFSPETMGPVFPHDRIGPGDTWTTKQTVKVPVADKPLTAVTKNKLLRLDKEHGLDVAIIRSVSAMPIDFEFDAKALERMTGAPAGMVPADVAVGFKGVLRFDGVQTVRRDNGRPIGVVGEGVFDMGVELRGMGEVPGGIKMRVEVEVGFAEVFGKSI